VRNLRTICKRLSNVQFLVGKIGHYTVNGLDLNSITIWRKEFIRNSVERKIMRWGIYLSAYYLSVAFLEIAPAKCLFSSSELNVIQRITIFLTWVGCVITQEVGYRLPTAAARRSCLVGFLVDKVVEFLWLLRVSLPILIPTTDLYSLIIPSLSLFSLDTDCLSMALQPLWSLVAFLVS
jgi:hypothetical protein